MQNDPIGADESGKNVYLKDIWPTPEEVSAVVKRYVRSEMFHEEYSEVFAGDERWNTVKVPDGDLYEWNPSSTYVRKPPYFENMADPKLRSRFGRPQRPRAAGRFRHHRPYFARRFHFLRQPRREIPDQARRETGRFQLLRRAPRQSRSDGARNVRQHPNCAT